MLSSSSSLEPLKRQFAIRVEEDRLVLAAGEVISDTPTPVEIDCQLLQDEESGDDERVSDSVLEHSDSGEAHTKTQAETSSEGGFAGDWLIGSGNTRLRTAIASLTSRHQIGNTEVAVSLSGDFCVTRILTGTIDHVDEELDALASRIPRYLKLGPGGKLTGQVRETLSPGIDHALTAVGNRTRLQALYEAFNDCDVKVAWIEPSLVSLARLVGMLGIDQDKPVLIADAFGQSWEVGIAHQGRLLLDYRPAAAHDSVTFARAIDQHLGRLRRFCQRHRGMDHSELNELYLGGPAEKIDPVMDYFHHSDSGTKQGLRISLQLPGTFMNVSVMPQHRSDSVAAVAALLPLIQPAIHQNPPDLLQTIRRDAGQTRWAWMVLTWWPAVAATLLLIATFVWVNGLRGQAAENLQKRNFVESQIRATRVRMAALQSDRRWVEHLNVIQSKTQSPPMSVLIRQITQCLPPRSALQSIRLEAEREIHLAGTTTEESEIYEIVGYLRRLPGIHQVALLGTTIGAQQGQSQFNIRLSWKPSPSAEQLASATQEFPDA